MRYPPFRTPQQLARPLALHIYLFLNGHSCRPLITIVYGRAAVMEAVLFSARLRLPLDTSSDGVAAAASRVIDLLDLSRVKDSRVGGSEKRGVSGGERRRVSIAQELVVNPVCGLRIPFVPPCRRTHSCAGAFLAWR